MLVKAIKDMVALSSQNRGTRSFTDASELGGQLTSLFPFLLTPFLGDSGPYTFSEHARAPPPIFCLDSGSGRPLLILPVGLVQHLPWKCGLSGAARQAGVCAVRAALASPGDVQNAVSTPESYSWGIPGV